MLSLRFGVRLPARVFSTPPDLQTLELPTAPLVNSGTSLECHLREPSPSGCTRKESSRRGRTLRRSSAELARTGQAPFRTWTTRSRPILPMAYPAVAGTADLARRPWVTGARCGQTSHSTSMTTTKLILGLLALASVISGCGPAPGAELEPSADAKQGTAVGRLGTDQGAEVKTGGGPPQSQMMKNEVESPN